MCNTCLCTEPEILKLCPWICEYINLSNERSNMNE
jgi:hypothetical protein